MIEQLRRRMPFNSTRLIVIIVGLAVTAALAVGAEINYQHGQQRLTSLQTSLTASVLGATPVDFERRLGHVVDVAANSADPPATFRRLIASSMRPSGPFAAASLIELSAGRPSLLVHLGIAPIRSVTGPTATALYVKAASSGELVTTRAVGHGIQKLGYMMAATGSAGTFVVSGAQSLPPRYVISIAPNSPDSGLNIAIYYGTSLAPSNLIASTNTPLPLTGTTSKVVVPFGAGSLTLVGAPRTSLAGTLSALLPWLIAGVGAVLTMVLAFLLERLILRGRHAENLARENERLYRQQRDIAVSMQQALVPRDFPHVGQAEFAAAYVPGGRISEVGGDWYSVIKTREESFYFVVGDVSGHGVEAAALMAQLRFTIRTLARLEHRPADILTLTSDDTDLEASDHLATVLVGLIEGNEQLTLASAGHLPPLLIEEATGEFVPTRTGLPLGVRADTYEEVSVPLPPGATLIAFTDGLVERRSESLDAGLERLRTAAISNVRAGVQELVNSIRETMIPQGSQDDSALLVVRCQPADVTAAPGPVRR